MLRPDLPEEEKVYTKPYFGETFSETNSFGLAILRL
jgi:hypothetical protein